MSNQRTEGFLDSLFDAVKPGNVISKLLQFLFFGLITATPYVVQNLDKVAQTVQDSGATGIGVIFTFFKALFGAMWIGVGIGLSTVFGTIIHIKDVIGELQIGTMIFSAIVIIFATLMIYQPTRLLFNILDLQKGREHSAVTIMAISLVLTLVVASPLAYLLSGGETITSGLDSDDEIEQPEEISGETMNETQTNETGIVNSINMLTG